MTNHFFPLSLLVSFISFFFVFKLFCCSNSFPHFNYFQFSLFSSDFPSFTVKFSYLQGYFHIYIFSISHLRSIDIPAIQMDANVVSFEWHRFDLPANGRMSIRIKVGNTKSTFCNIDECYPKQNFIYQPGTIPKGRKTSATNKIDKKENEMKSN